MLFALIVAVQYLVYIMSVQLFIKGARIKGMSTDEKGLIVHILNGNQQAYAQLIDRYKQQVYRHCFYIVRDEDIAEDMAQEAFIKAYMHLKRYDPAKAAFKTWVFTIATRQCLTYLRRNKPIPLEQDLIESTQPPTDHLAKQQELIAAVTSLNPKYRTAITLFYWHGYSYEEIASAMDAPIGSIRSWIFRAKKQLKEALL